MKIARVPTAVPQCGHIGEGTRGGFPTCCGRVGAYPGKFLKYASPKMHSRAFLGPEMVFLEGTVQLIENKHCLRNRKFT